MLTVKIDTRQFDKTFGEYLAWNKRQPAEIVNAKLYFVALQAMNLTKIAEKQKILAELNAPSHVKPSKTLGEILLLRDLKRKGRMPKKGSTLAGKLEKYLKAKVSRIQFLRSGWLPSLKKLDFWNRRGDIKFVKRFESRIKKPQGVKQYGKDKGGVIPARINEAKVRGTISNNIGVGKQDSPTVRPILTEGLSQAVSKEISSMRTYIERKFNEQHTGMKRKGQII